MKNFTVIREFYAALVSLIKRHVPMQAMAYDVVSIDKENATCVIKESDGDNIEDVRLKSVVDDSNIGLVVFPKVGSSVIAQKIMNDEQNLFIAKINEIDSIKISIKDKFEAELKDSGDLVFNSGDNKGLVIHDKAKQNFDSLKTYIDALEGAAGLIATALDGLVPGTSVAYNAASEPAKAACQLIDMQNEKIKH
jgi:hypothetical protein